MFAQDLDVNTCFQVWLFPVFLFVVAFTQTWGLIAEFLLKIVQSQFSQISVSLARAT